MMAISEQQLQSDLFSAGIIRAASLMSLMALVLISHIYADKIQIGMDEQQRVIIRTVLYVIAILTFPVMQFVRHVMLRLQRNEKPPKSRYFLAIMVTMIISESIGIYGFIMYVLGDSYNTLYIFTMLSALAMFLHKPDKEEYKALFE
ncbi:MAG: hypothetical protein GQ583_07970 [Methyloprofundus sp.]|nr:hypothetical protein [Methyloprofundus sp.]